MIYAYLCSSDHASFILQEYSQCTQRINQKLFNTNFIKISIFLL